MKKTICFVGLLFFFASPLVAQRQRLDSLYKAIHKLKQNQVYEKDTNYINTLHELAYAYDAIKPDSMRILAVLSKGVAENAGYKKGISRALQDLGIYYYGAGDYIKATEHLFEALHIAEEIKHPKTIASCYNNLALVYSEQKQTKKALEFHFKVLRIREEIKDEAGSSTALNNIGSTYSTMKESQKALEYHFKALKINEKYNDKQGLAYNYDNIGYEFFVLNKIDTALYYLEKSFKLTQEIGDEDMESEVSYNLARCEIAKKAYNKALQYAQKSFEISKKLNKKATIHKGYEILSQVYEAMGKPELALQNYKLFKESYDSLVNRENTHKSYQLQAQYEYDKKANQLKTEQQKKLYEQRIYTYISITAFLFVSILVVVLYRNQKRILHANHVISEQKVEIESQNAELEAQAEYLRDVNALKDRLLSIIGHDLKTPINQIKGILPILEAGGLTPEDFQFVAGGIKQSLTHASDLLDNLFRWALSQLGGEMLKPQTFDLRPVIENNLELYEQVAQKKNITVVNTLQHSIRIYADMDMIDLVVRNLLSNGLKFCKGNDTITFTITEDEKIATICVQDTGTGIAPEVLPTLFGEGHISQRGTAGEKGTGLGLTLCRDFVEKNGGTIWVESTVGKGSGFYFTVPKHAPVPY